LASSGQRQFWRRREDRDRALRVKGPSGPLTLVVEDEPDFREKLLGWLRTWGFGTVHAVTADDAFHAAQTLRPKVITVDYGLLCRDGSDLRTGWDLLEALNDCPDTRDLDVVVVREAGRAAWDRLNVRVCPRSTEPGRPPVDPDKLLAQIRDVCPAAQVLEGATAPDPSAPHLLIAGEDHAAADFISRTLSSEGYRVDVADTGSGALRRLNRHAGDYAALVVELGLSGVDGFDVIRAARLGRIAPDMPIVVVTPTRGALSREQARIIREGTFLETVDRDDLLRNPATLRNRLAELLGSQNRSRRPLPEALLNPAATTDPLHA
jgi:CheY-like chemotaxis protein